MIVVRAAGALPLLLVLAGCAGGADSELRDHVAAVVVAGNDRDADRLRMRADKLIETLDAQASRGDLGADEADRLRALATSVRTHADVIDAELIRRQREQAEAERQRLEQERARVEEERKQLEEDRKKAKEDEEKDKGKDKKDDEGDD